MNREEIKKEISKNIKVERVKNNLTQEEVAFKLGVTLRTYSSYEKDACKISAIHLLMLSKIFNCEITDFYLNVNFTECKDI